MKRVWQASAAAALCLALASCGGGVGDLAEGGIGGTGFTIGPISAFGSIYVNGVRYATDQAQISIDGEPVGAEQLRLGMVVTVTTGEDSGVARSVSFADDLRGPVARVDSRAGYFELAGHTVRVDERSVFDGLDGVAGLAVGDWVRVSGLAVADGEFRATWVARPAQIPAEAVRLRGRVAELDAALYRFKLGSLSVDYSRVPVLPVMPADGDWLEVAGELEGGVLRATRLVPAAPPHLAADAPLSLRGHLTRYASAEDFELAFRPARVTPQTQFAFGGAADLRPGAELTAHGRPDAHGVLVLERVEFNSAASGRGAPGRLLVSAPLAAVDLAQGQIRLFGVMLQVPPGTLFSDPAQPQAQFGLAELVLGERLAVHGFLDLASGAFVAERVQRETSAPPRPPSPGFGAGGGRGGATPQGHGGASQRRQP